MTKHYALVKKKTTLAEMIVLKGQRIKVLKETLVNQRKCYNFVITKVNKYASKPHLSR